MEELLKSAKARFAGGGAGKADAKAGKADAMTPQEEAWDVAKTVVYAVAIALVLRIVIFQPFNIPSGSMKPTLLVGDFLFVSKPSYGYSRASLVYPLTRLPIDGRLFGGEGPARGDVVVFKNRREGNKDYIKRVIGLPGDRIDMIDGRLHINGVAVPKEPAGERPDLCGGSAQFAGAAQSYVETLANGVSYTVVECSGDRGGLDNVGPYLVPADHYFMMGDNRDRSQDSRVGYQVGYVHSDDIVGKAERLFFSVDGSNAQFWQIWKWPVSIRYGRILAPVD